MKLPITPLILAIVTLLVTLVVSMPTLADSWREGKHGDWHEDQHRHKDKYRHKEYLPPGLHKKAHYHDLPPGWHKRLVRGKRLDYDLYRHGYIIVDERELHRYHNHDRVIVIHDRDRRYWDDRYSHRDGLITVRIDNRLIRMVEATHEIVDILN